MSRATTHFYRNRDAVASPAGFGVALP